MAAHIALKYFSATERMKRIFFTIVFFYLFLNGSKFNICYGIYWAGQKILETGDLFWVAVVFAALLVVVFFLGAFMMRRWNLVRTQANFFLLGLQTAALVITIAIIVAMAGRFMTESGYYEYTTYGQIALWTWQIPLGFLIGKGLSWSIVDRKTSGVYATDERAVEDQFTS